MKKLILAGIIAAVSATAHASTSYEKNMKRGKYGSRNLAYKLNKDGVKMPACNGVNAGLTSFERAQRNAAIEHGRPGYSCGGVAYESNESGAYTSFEKAQERARQEHSN